MFPLRIFPENSLAQSVITTVWVGVFVVSYFNLRLGWPFSGLVVPGYLVPLMIAKPTAAAVVCIEGFLTYLIVRYACNHYMGSGLWSSFFGRDRFFALIVASIIVRLLLDGILLPLAGEFINRRLNIDFDYRNHLSSFGLIIVALIANQFWKTGFVRGLVPFWTTVGITYAIIRFVLIPYTNFNIGNLEYMYENISTSLVASPKAYIILLTSGFIASRLNLLYGWDFSGILIPSLLALQWYNPQTIATTFLEAFIIFFLAIAVLKSPLFQKITVEGARKFLLFFNISFLYKMALGYFQESLHTDMVLTDLFGYGYLVPTLIAIKMHDKNIPLRVTRSTLQASFTGALLASALGFALTFVPIPRGEALTRQSTGDGESAVAVRSLGHLLRTDKLLLYRQRKENSFLNPLPVEVERFADGLRSLVSYQRTRDAALLERARSSLADIGYDAILVGEKHLYLRESEAPRGWGFYAINLERREGLVIEVPAPIEEWAVYEAGAVLFERFDARALAVSGCARRSKKDGSSDVLGSGRTLYSMFHRVFARRDVLQIRGYSDESLAAMRQGRAGADGANDEPRSSLWVKGRIPAGLDLARLKDLVGSYHVEWGRTRLRNLQRDETVGAFAELVLSRPQRKRLLGLSAVHGDSRTDRFRVERASLHSWLLPLADALCPAGSNLCRKALQEELLYFDEEVLVPLIDLAGRIPAGGDPLEQHTGELTVIGSSASLFDYELILLSDEERGERFLVLEERRDSEQRRCWGTYVLRLCAAGPFLVEIPRPLVEENSFEYGIHLFERIRARFLLIAGSHPLANVDRSSDVIRPSNKHSLFCLVQQAVQRELESQPLLVVQVRGLGREKEGEEIGASLLLSMASGCPRRDCLPATVRDLVESLDADGLGVLIAAGDERTAGHDAAGSRLAHYSDLVEGHEFCMLWVAPEVRRSFAQTRWSGQEAEKLASLGVPTEAADLFERLLVIRRGRRPAECSDEVVRLVQRYVATRDIAALDRLARHPEVARLERLIDTSTNQAFLAVYPAGDAFPTLFRLSRFDAIRPQRLAPDALSRESVDQLVRSPWSHLVLVPEPEP